MANGWALAAGVAAFVGSFVLAQWTGGETAPLAVFVEATPTPPIKGDAPATPESAHSDGKPKSVRQPIRDALAGDDPMASAKRMLAWLETTTAETFRELAKEPGKFPVPQFSGFGAEFRAAYLDALAARWFEQDPEGALPGLKSLQEGGKQWWNEYPLDAAARVRPDLVLEKLPMENKGGYLENFAREALSTLAARDLKAAQLFAERCTSQNARAQADGAIITGVAQSDPLKAAAMAREKKSEAFFPAILQAAEKMGPGAIRQVLQTLGDQIGPYTITPDFAMRHPELLADLPQKAAPKNATPYVTEQTLAAAERLSPEERDRVLADPALLPETARESTIAAIVSNWARTEPQRATEWAVAHGKSEDGANKANTAVEQAFLRWVNSDADAALTWWRAQPASPLRDALGTNASTFLAEDGRTDAALEMFRPGGGQSETQAVEHMAQILAERDPAQAGAWFAALPDGVVNERTTRAIVSRWYAREPEKVARWVESLPAGASRDEAARAFIAQASQQSPAGAAEWVATVADPELRRKSVEWVFFSMSREDPAGARNWLRDFRGVDAEWQARFLRRNP